MQIEIKCFATLSDFTPEGNMMTVEDGATIQQVIDALGIKTEDVKIMFINGKHQSLSSVLSEGDRLGLFPAVGGG
ncbi:MoaD/ThiS family protein [Halodesulfovibrio sp.]|jgi:molybdopterin converting factor small subunit|uniref:MoaD/ThiS family protein n=1 Tax=Halodesulfovibrio sp. TaxID=1912772 RepID=UPI0025F2F07F|nr:MoaD/ThiS family protein [Halodesulfovibrio sp.]MCT4536176.1 MoaD/ThiS family protein [Halodesulfovibrio sp.]MCT4626820.1 MoaD/ThiS family protein [Halodesulfovibrio sp.]